MELHQLRYFVAAAEAGSMSRAADRCAVAQPSLSQQIRKLECSLGVRLFDRLGRGVALTDEGRALLPRAQRVLAEVREAEERLRAGDPDGTQRLAVGAIPTMAPYLLPPVLASLREALPGCEIVVREDLTGHLVEALVDNEIDVGVMSTPVDHHLIDLEVVGSEELLVVMPCAHGGGGGGGTITLDELRAHPAVTLHEMHCLGQQIGGFCASRGVAPRVACRTTQLSTVLELVRLGLGVSLAPEMAASADDGLGREYRRIRSAPPRREIALAWRVGRTRSAPARRFAELLGERLRP